MLCSVYCKRPDSAAELLSSQWNTHLLIVLIEENEKRGKCFRQNCSFARNKVKWCDCRKLLNFRHLTLIMSLYCVRWRNKIIVTTMLVSHESVLLRHSVKLSQCVWEEQIRQNEAGSSAQNKHTLEVYFRCTDHPKVI